MYFEGLRALFLCSVSFHPVGCEAVIGALRAPLRAPLSYVNHVAPYNEYVQNSE